MGPREVALVSERLAVCQGAGLPLYRAVGTQARMLAGTDAGRVLEAIATRMADGTSFSGAVREHEQRFGPLAVSLIEAGEASGRLEFALRRLAAITQSRLALVRKVRKAMVYPAVVLTITTALVAAMLLVVVPKFETLYADFGSDLPLLTRTLVSLSGLAPFVAGGAVLAGIAGYLVLRAARTSAEGRRRIEAVSHRIPVVGPLLVKAAQARAAATLATLLSAGVPLLRALELAGRTSGSQLCLDAYSGVRAAISEGATLTDALARGRFPELMVQLAEVGEESGELPELLERYAGTAADEVDTAAEAMASLLEPALLVVIGAIVGVFLVGLYLPIVSLGENVR